MDQLGPTGCREHLDDLIQEIYKNGMRNISLLGAMVKYMPEQPVKEVIKHLVLSSIKAHEAPD